MSYYATPQVAGGATIDASFATYGLALADARANGAAGDYYRLTTDGGVWRFLGGTGGAGFLVPADWYDRLSDVVNASGSCYLTSGDDSAALIARGWVEETATGGTVTYDADELILTATTTSGSRARVAFTPTGTPNNFFWVLEISSLSFGGGTPDAGYAGILTRNAADFIKAGFSEGAAFVSTFCGASSSGTTNDTASTEMALSGPCWVMGLMDAGAGKSLLFQEVGAGLKVASMPSDNADADATGRVIRIEAVKSTSGVSVAFRVKNFRCWSFA